LDDEYSATSNHGLKVNGAPPSWKRGTMVKNIHLTDDVKETSSALKKCKDMH